MLDRARQSLARMIAPRHALRRLDAASGGRGWGQTPPFGRVATETLAGSGLIRGRARHAYANNPHARAAVDAWVAALVGTGARATPTHPDAEARTTIGAAIDTWANVADIAGRTDWWGLQAEIVRAVVIDGEAVVLMLDTPDGLRLRQIPAELLDEAETRTLYNGGEIVGGVEFSKDGRRVAYHIRPEAPASVFATWAPPERIDAANVLHIFKPIGAGQVRGISWLTPVLLKLNEIDQLTDALVVGAKTAAMFAGFLRNVNNLPSDDMPFDGVTAGSIMESGLEPGTLKVLPSGWDIEFASPQQAQQAPEFLSAELRSVAVGCGVPDHLVSGDLRQANYSSLRADLVSFRQRVEQVQYGVLAPQLLRPAHARAVTSLILSGAIDAPGFEGEPATWTGAEFIMPAQPWVDPAKDAKAIAELMAAGLMSRRQAVAERGWSVEELDAEIAADREREAAMGLSFGAAPTPETVKGEPLGDA
jgi:lambda family phage portal protein